MLLSRYSNKRFNYRIGGRAERLAYSPDTLRREMKEEWDVEVNVGRLPWTFENRLAPIG